MRPDSSIFFIRLNHIKQPFGRSEVVEYWQFYVVQDNSKGRDGFQTQKLIFKLRLLTTTLHCFANEFILA